jgi:hypothetical protein
MAIYEDICRRLARLVKTLGYYLDNIAEGLIQIRSDMVEVEQGASHITLV